MGKEKKVKEKALDKMTAKELRTVAMEIPGVVGASGMNKPELISVIKKAKGIVDTAPQNTNGSVRELKKKLRAMKAEHAVVLQGDDPEKAARMKKKIRGLKRMTRRVA